MNVATFMLQHDPECRMFFFADAFHLNPDIDSEVELSLSTREVIIQESTHAVSGTEDVVKYNYPEKNFRRSGEEVLEEFVSGTTDILEIDVFNKFVNQLAEELNLPNLSHDTVTETIKIDPVLWSNFQMTNAEMVMVILRDFASGRGFEDELRITRDLNDVKLRKGRIFLFKALTYVYGY